MSYIKVTLDGGVSSGVAWVSALVCQRCGTLVQDAKGSQERHDRLHGDTEPGRTIEEYEDGTPDEPDREGMMPAIEIDADNVPVRLSGGSAHLTGDAETPPPNWGDRVEQFIGNLPYDRPATFDERIAAAHLRIAGWDVVPPYDVRQCEEPCPEAADQYDCNIELAHFGMHRWMVEGDTCGMWPQ